MKEKAVQGGHSVLVILIAIAVAIPTLAAVELASYQSEQTQRDRALSLATILLHRAEHVSEQLGNAITTLESARLDQPCSPAGLKLMQGLALKSGLLVDVGYIKDGHLLCSSFGIQDIPVGKPTYVSSAGFHIRSDFRSPLAPNTKLFVSTKPDSGYSGFVNEAVITDAMADDGSSEILLGLGQHRPILVRGEFREQWLKRIGAADALTFVDGPHLVAWRQSSRFAYGAIVALPQEALTAARVRALLIMTPVGLLAGLAMAWALARLAQRRTSLPALLRQGLERGELSIVYQPIVDLATSRWVGAEALLRWQRIDGEFVSPDIFIPIAEQSGLIDRVTEKVLRLVEESGPAILAHDPDFFVAINLSAHDLGDAHLVERLNDLVDTMRARPANLHVEATERVFLDIAQTRRTVEALHKAGFKVSIDDFGTGYSSLSYLTDLRMDGLKIDKTFVNTIGTESVTSRVINHIIEMAKSLELWSIAEGVETEQQASYLREHGVKYAQGWLYARPMSAERLCEALKQRLADG